VKKDKEIKEALTSEKLTGLKLKKAKESAAGMSAVISSVKHIASEVGLGRGAKVLLNLNQKGGIDCPGCAWPDPDDDRSRLGEYCENGAKAIAEEATKKKLTAKFFAQNSVSSLSKLSDFEIGKSGRLAQPMYLAEGASHYTEISWDEAFTKIAAHLNACNHPDEAIFYTSGRTSNEAAFLYQLFVRAYGTNNLPDCSNMCHESSGAALSETLGIGKGSVKLEDFYETDLIIIMGQNPGTNHPRMLSALEKAKTNGAKIITVNPIKEAGLIGFMHPQKISGLLGQSTELTDLYLQVQINADMALLQALAKLLLDKERKSGGIIDHDFINNKTEHYESYVEHLDKLDLNKLIEETGLSRSEIEAGAEMIAANQKIIICWAMGLTQHKNSVNTIKELVNILLMRGSIGKPGAGTCPVRGHSNVQGDRTMGIHEKPPSRLLDKIESTYGFNPPRNHGYDTVAAIEAMYENKAKVFFGMGGNFISATPDTNYTAQALQNCNLTVQVSTKLNRSHLVHGKEAIILPCLGRTDKDIQNGELQFVSVENSMGIVHSSKGSLRPVSDQLLSEVAIVCKLAKATLADTSIDWDKYLSHYDHIRDDIEKVINGFDNYNERVRNDAGFYLPNCARDNSYNTDTGKAKFSVSTFTKQQLQADQYMMMTIRSHDQFNTTIYGLDDRYRGIENERRVILMNTADMKTAGLQEGDVVDLSNEDDERLRIALKFIVVAYDIPHKCVATYFPEANVLVPIKSKALKSNTPASKSVVIKVAKHVASND
jgi:molybdopterin-dependent oxidoreductase alpha subunit